MKILELLNIEHSRCSTEEESYRIKSVLLLYIALSYFKERRYINIYYYYYYILEIHQELIPPY